MRQSVNRSARVYRVPVMIGLTVLLVGLSANLAFADTPAPTEPVTVTLIQAILIGLGYYLSQGPWLMGLGFWTLYRPLVAGFLVGVIMGDPGKGALIGATINLVYLGFISAGGAIPGDPALAGWVGTAIALAGNLDYGAALALAVPVGLLGTVIWNARMTVGSAFAHMADRAAENADIPGLIRANVLWPQLWLFTITAIPVTIAVYLGAGFIGGLVAGFPAWLLNGLAISGGVLPAIGIAMNMRFIFKGSAIPFFFLGYFAMIVAGASLTMMILAIVGAGLAILHVHYLGDRVKGVSRDATTKPAAVTTSQGAGDE